MIYQQCLGSGMAIVCQGTVVGMARNYTYIQQDNPLLLLGADFIVRTAIDTIFYSMGYNQLRQGVIKLWQDSKDASLATVCWLLEEIKKNLEKKIRFQDNLKNMYIISDSDPIQELLVLMRNRGQRIKNKFKNQPPRDRITIF